jgi:hypothetical protein
LRIIRDSVKENRGTTHAEPTIPFELDRSLFPALSEMVCEPV